MAGAQEGKQRETVVYAACSLAAVLTVVDVGDVKAKSADVSVSPVASVAYSFVHVQ